MRRITNYSIAIMAMTIALLTYAAPNSVQAQEIPTPNREALELAEATSEQLGHRTAGWYLDDYGNPVITVTKEADAAWVRAAGVTSKVVTYSGADLDRVVEALKRSVQITGTAWGVDPKANQVVVKFDNTVDDGGIADLASVTHRFGDAVRLEYVDGEIITLIRGGDTIIGNTGFRCSLGFNVLKPSTGKKFFFTAGHCNQVVNSWSDAQGRFLGPRIGFNYPGEDNGIARHDNNLPQPGTVWNCKKNQAQHIASARLPAVGQWVNRTGSTTCGTIGQVQLLNVTVNYGDGPVNGLIEVNICAKPGDSGGPMFNAPEAFGLTSGGVLNDLPCNISNPSGTTFYEPVVRALQRWPEMEFF